MKNFLSAAPLLFKKIERVEGIMFLFFIAMLVQALIEREIRRLMKEEKIEDISIYPENRPATAPTTSVIFDQFEDISVYHLMKEGKTVEKYKDELNDPHKIILQLLNITPEGYWANKN